VERRRHGNVLRAFPRAAVRHGVAVGHAAQAVRRAVASRSSSHTDGIFGGLWWGGQFDDHVHAGRENVRRDHSSTSNRAGPRHCYECRSSKRDGNREVAAVFVSQAALLGMFRSVNFVVLRWVCHGRDRAPIPVGKLWSIVSLARFPAHPHSYGPSQFCQQLRRRIASHACGAGAADEPATNAPRLLLSIAEIPNRMQSHVDCAHLRLTTIGPDGIEVRIAGGAGGVFRGFTSAFWYAEAYLRFARALTAPAIWSN